MARDKIIGGIILLVLGVIFLLMNYGLLAADLWKLWPLLLMAIGAGLLLRGEGKK